MTACFKSVPSSLKPYECTSLLIQLPANATLIKEESKDRVDWKYSSLLSVAIAKTE